MSSALLLFFTLPFSKGFQKLENSQNGKNISFISIFYHNPVQLCVAKHVPGFVIR